MFVQFLQRSLIAAMVTSLFASYADAQCGTCDSCGEEVVCKKVCCLKCEYKEVEFTCYKSEFEDICVPGCSTRCGDHCVSACSCKDGADGCGKKRILGIWQPSCADVKTRRRLMYKKVTRKVPVYTWELKTQCHACCKGCSKPSMQLPEGIPAVPECAELIDVRAAEAEFRRKQVASLKPKSDKEVVSTQTKPIVIPATAKPTAEKVVQSESDANDNQKKVVIAKRDDSIIRVAKPVVRQSSN